MTDDVSNYEILQEDLQFWRRNLILALIVFSVVYLGTVFYWHHVLIRGQEELQETIIRLKEQIIIETDTEGD